MNLKRVAGMVAAVVVLVVVAVLGGQGGEAPPPSSVTVTTANNKVIEAPVEAVDAAAGAKAEVGLSGDGNARTQRSSDRANPDAPVVSGPVPAASPYQRGCLTRSNTVNYSFRNGTKPSIGVLHLTVAPNRAGWGDINGVAVFLNRAATQASSNYIIDAEGHCIYTVAEVFKAWTQANLNSASACSFEVQNTGNEATYAGSAGLAKVALVWHDCAARWHLPLRRASVSGGVVRRAGLIDHFHLGAAGGGHVDVHNFGARCANAGPSADTWACVDAVNRAARALDVKPITAGQRKRCQELNGLRRAKHGGSDRAKAIRAGFKAHGVRCLKGPPGRIERR